MTSEGVKAFHAKIETLKDSSGKAYVMCGRFTLFSSAKELAELFDAELSLDIQARYNIAPTSQVLALRVLPENRLRSFSLMRWGLIPPWAKDPKIGSRMINARSETLDEKPSFATAFISRRCLIVTDGFFEWEQKTTAKTPYYIRMTNGKPFAFAGLWERWQSPSGRPIGTCTIITTQANAVLAPFHHRMPVIVDPKDFDDWLNPDNAAIEDLKSLFRPFTADRMIATPVGGHVNNARHEGPRCIEPEENDTDQKDEPR